MAEGVDLNVADQWGRTALSFAAGAGHQDIVQLLIEGGAWVDPHEDYDTYETPLVAAAENGHLTIVQTLIRAGADPRIHAGVTQATAEFYARQNGHVEVSSFLRSLTG
jgi:ankyrin repeat protein